jgi:hypothetical protein
MINNIYTSTKMVMNEKETGFYSSLLLTPDTIFLCQLYA